jgi:nucleosome assembly protein 1-like 1
MIQPSTELASTSNTNTTPVKSSKSENPKNTSTNLDDSLLDTDKANPLLQLLQLPKPILRRVNALKNLQLKMVDIETGFYEELHQLECKYMSKYEGIFAQRKQIVMGEYEPNDDEAKWDYEDVLGEMSESEEAEAAAVAAAVTAKADVNSITDGLNSVDMNAKDKKVAGIPEFWLQAFKSSDLLCEMMQPHDELVLKYLSDIKIVMHDRPPIGYTIEFHFSKNEYFSNEKLTKTYGLTTEKDRKDPLSYDGPVFYKCEGCEISWHKDKNVTVKVIKKKQKHKSSGQVRVISKEEKQDSFFNFFETPTSDGIRPSFKEIMSKEIVKIKEDKNEENEEEEDDDDDLDEENENLYEADFEIGHFFKEFLVPKAVLYFTGEMTDEAEYEDGEYEDEDLENGEIGGADSEEEDNANELSGEEDEQKSPTKVNSNSNKKSVKAKQK